MCVWSVCVGEVEGGGAYASNTSPCAHSERPENSHLEQASILSSTESEDTD